MKNITLTILFLLIFYPIIGQSSSTMSDSVSINLIKQLDELPEEKIHLHIDKPYYILGEKIWVKCYLVDASSHYPIDASRYIYLELVTPLGEIVQRIKVRQNKGTYSGYIPLEDDLAEGNYTLRAYTNYILNVDEDYFAYTTVQIKSPISTSIEAKVDFNLDIKGKVDVRISLIDVKSGQRKDLDDLTASIDSKEPKHIKINKSDSVAQLIFKDGKILYLKYGNYEKYIQIPTSENEFDVSFHPEGGYMLEGLYSKVAFKALNAKGWSEPISGHIIDETGLEIAELETLDKGMGFFFLKPEKGKTYYAKCKNSKNIWKQIPLPQARDKGYALSVNTVKNKIYISVLSTTDSKASEPLHLLIHTRGIPQYSGNWDAKSNVLILDKTEFPSGVSQIVLSDANKNLLSERLFFCLNDDQAAIAFSPDKASYKTRDYVKSNIKVTDSNNNPLNANLSISVTDNKDVAINKNVNILSTLLLSSELKGYIENPASYLDKDSKVNQIALDLLMLTQGWRRYNVPEVIKGKIQKPNIPIELSQNISGTIEGGLFKTTTQKNCKVNLLSVKNGYYDEVVTDEMGRFNFDGFEFPDSTKFVVQALSKHGKDNVILTIDNESFPLISKGFRAPILQENAPLAHYVEKAELKYAIENGIRMVFLKEVSILGKKQDKKASYYMNIANKTFSTDYIEKSGMSRIQDIVRNTSGVQIIDNKVYITRFTQVGYPALILVDDQPMDDNFDLNDLNITDIEEIGVIKGAQAGSMLGARGGAGAVVIRTKTGNSKNIIEPKEDNIKSIMPLGYQQPISFYSPKYETAREINDKQPDLRTTIYWNSNINTSSLGEASVDFYTADFITDYSVIIEGMTTDGKIVYGINKIKVTN